MPNEYSSARLASLAAKVLTGHRPSAAEARALAASVLTQAHSKPKKRVAKKAKQ